MALLPSITPAQVEVRIKFSMFFDRAGVASGISKAKRAGLNKAGFAVMGIARRSIKKMGEANKLPIEKTYGNMTLQQIAALPGVSTSREETMRDSRGRFLKGSGRLTSRDGLITEADRRKVLEKIWQLRFRKPSPAGFPPFTWGGQLRNSITFDYDSATESVVVGGFMRGIPRLVSLHEYGGSQTMIPWAWVQPSHWRNTSGILWWRGIDRGPPRNASRWHKMGGQWARSFTYPARPYMRPALMEGIKRGRIPKGFGNSVNFTGG